MSKETEFVIIRNRCSTWQPTPAQDYTLLPGVNMLRRAAWAQLLDAKERTNGLPSHCAKLLRDRIADGTLVVESVDAQLAANLGRLVPADARKLLAETFRPSLVARWLQAEKRAAIREAAGRRICALLGYDFKHEVASSLATMCLAERDEYVMGMGAGLHRQKLCADAGLYEWKPPAPAPRDPFGPVL